MEKMECRLEGDDGHVVTLTNGKVLTLGRVPATGVTDKRCARQQVELVADFSKKCVCVKQLGINPTTVGLQTLQRLQTVEAQDGCTIYLVNGRYPFQVRFVDVGNLKRHDSSTQPDSGQTDLSHPVGLTTPKRTMRDYFLPPHGSQQLKRSAEDQNDGSKASVKKRKAEATVEGGAMSDTWETHGKLMVFTSCSVLGSSMIAGFDIDGTIVTTKSGKVFPVNADDWRILYPEILPKLKQLLADGYKVVFLTNQMGISRGKLQPEVFKTKVEAIIETLQLPVQVLVATGRDVYRKPVLGMWEYLCDKANDGISVDVTKSLYVGDAAGRPANWAPGKKKKDFSCSDRLFSLNAGLPFHTPEEFFLGWKPATFNLPEFDPRTLDEEHALISPTCQLVSDDQEVIVAVGFPASGKSTFFKDHLVPKGYAYINRDTLGSWQKCVSACIDYLHKDRSVVIDNTNLELESRKRYVDCAQEANVPCRCFLFTASFEHCKHNNRFREMTETEHVPVNIMVMNSSRSKYVAPALTEGFTEIVRVGFVPRFADPHLAALYRQFSEG
uniref:bifunctional polynucleotide phosphatase/kinase isoform X3 n=1 Tax=Myxine glutinosa TaxID=7769 RepID=UPI00358E3440